MQFREIFRKSSYHVNTNKGSAVKQSGNDVEGYRPQKVLFQPNIRVILKYSQAFINECSISEYPSNLKACNSPYVQYYFKRIFCFAFLGSYIFISDQKSRQKAIEIGTVFFHSLGNPKGHTLDHLFYASCICHHFPCKLIPISMS